MKRILFYFLMFILSLSLTGAVFAQSEGKIGYVDLSRAFDEYEKTKDFDKALEKKGDLKQEQREDLVKDIRKMRDEIDLLNEKAKGKKEKDIEEKIRFLQEFDQNAKAELTKERDDMVRDILKEMNGVIQDYGENHGYSIILNERILLYGEKSRDLTEEIIKILNDNYKE
ncbi:MAG: OmpH family outer membrane protein [Candidatus Omnitrophica bacterium]|nr:OmpH family outer membrane protein [Candidatus Omnitrophota bacterium]